MGNTLTLTVETEVRGANANIDKLNKAIQSIDDIAKRAGRGAAAGFSDIERSALRVSARVKQEWGGLGKIISAAFAFRGAQQIFNITKEFENTSIAIETFTGGARQAGELIQKIRDLARQTPFGFTELADTTKRLLAMNFTAAEIPKTLRAVSAAAAALGSGAVGVDRITLALGQIRAAGRLTGQELRQLTEANVHAINLLAEAYGKTTGQIKKLIEQGAIPASDAIEILVDGMNTKFNALLERSFKSVGTQASNLVDELKNLAIEVGNIFKDDARKGFESLQEVVRSLTNWIKENRGEIRGFAESIGYIGIVIGTYKVVELLAGVVAQIRAAGVASAANPWALAAAGLVWVGLILKKNYDDLERFSDAQKKAFDSTQIQNFLNNGKTARDLERLGYSVEQVKDALGAGNIREFSAADSWWKQEGLVVEFLSEREKAMRKNYAESLKAAELERQREEFAKKLIGLESRAADILQSAQKKEFDGLARILEEHRQYQAELGKSAKANALLSEAVKIRLATEAGKQLRANATDAIKAIQTEGKARRDVYAEEFKDRQKFESDTLEMQIAALDKSLGAEQDAIKFARDSRIRALEAVDARTLEQKLAIEQQKLAIEVQSIEQSTAVQVQEIERRKEREISYVQFLARLYPERAALIEQRIAAINEQAATDRQSVERNAANDAQRVREEAAIKSAQLIRQNTEGIFNQFKSSAERVFDALLSKSESVWDAIGNSMKTALLTAIKEVVTSQVARLLTQLVSGRAVGLQGSTGGGGLGGFLGALGLGGIPAFGGGGLAGLVGGPGGTGGFAGPVNLPGIGGTAFGVGIPGTRGGIGAAGGLAGLAGFGSLFFNSGSIALGGGAATTAAGIGGLGGSLAGIASSPAGIAGGGLLAMLGLQRGGVSGGLMAAGGGALAGFGVGAMIGSVGGPLGMAIGAIAGGVAGLIRGFVKGATDKAKEKIKSVYGVSVNDNNLLKQIVATAKQSYGGNLDVAIRSTQVRDLIELYAMATGQNSSKAGANVPRPLAVSQSGGVLSAMPLFQNGLQVSAPSLNPSGGSGVTVVVQNQIAGEDVAGYLRGEVKQTIVDSPRETQGAVMRASNSSYGRRNNARLTLQPGALVG